MFLACLGYHRKLITAACQPTVSAACRRDCARGEEWAPLLHVSDISSQWGHTGLVHEEQGPKQHSTILFIDPAELAQC
jgi:hypothetical protein